MNYKLNNLGFMYKTYSIVLVRDWKDGIVMGRRNDNNLYTQPGGGANKGECAYACALREFFEETGVALTDIELIKVLINKNKDLIYMFEGKIPENCVFDTSKDPDLEVDEWSFMDPNDVKEELHVPIEENAIIKYWMDN